MTTVAPRAESRRRISVRAPITGVVLVLIVVLGTYWGYQKAFGVGGGSDEAASDDCATTTTTTATTAPTTSTTTSAASGSVQPAGAITTIVTATPSPSSSALVLSPGDFEVNVYNATLRRGLANDTAALLRDRGFVVDSVQNDPLDAEIPGIAQIRAARSDLPEVRLLLQHVPGAVVVPDGREGTSVDLVLGETFVALGDPALVTPVPIDTPRC